MAYRRHLGPRRLVLEFDSQAVTVCYGCGRPMESDWRRFPTPPDGKRQPYCPSCQPTGRRTARRGRSLVR